MGGGGKENSATCLMSRFDLVRSGYLLRTEPGTSTFWSTTSTARRTCGTTVTGTPASLPPYIGAGREPVNHSPLRSEERWQETRLHNGGPMVDDSVTRPDWILGWGDPWWPHLSRTAMPATIHPPAPPLATFGSLSLEGCTDKTEWAVSFWCLGEKGGGTAGKRCAQHVQGLMPQ